MDKMIRMIWKTVKLNSGHDMPSIGLGTYSKDLSKVKSTIKKSLEIGVRHIDTAFNYHNEKEVGNGLKESFEEKLVKREDVFVVSKLWSTKHTKEDVKQSLKESLKRIQLSYLDLYLIHWPMPFKSGDDDFPIDKDGNALFGDVSYLETWKALEQCVDEGLIKSIGLSNFNSLQLKDILDHCKIKPSVLQVEMHPYLQQDQLVNFCKAHGVVVAAHSPLGSPARPWVSENEVGMLEDPMLQKMAARMGKTRAQVVLRWILQKGCVAIPKSTNPGRIQQNLNVFDFELNEEDMRDIEGINKGMRYCFPKDFHPGKADWTKVHQYPFNAEF